MSFKKINKAVVASKQNIIDIAVQEFGSVDAIFKVIDQNKNWSLSIDESNLSNFVTQKINADNQTEQEIEAVKTFFLNDTIVVNEDLETIPSGDYSSGYSGGYTIY